MKPAVHRLSLLLAAALALSGCSSLKLPSLGLPGSAPVAEPAQPGVEPSTAAIARIRATLLTLRSDPALAARVPVELTTAEEALQKADKSQYDKINGSHLIYIAEHKAEYARTVAEQRALEAEYEILRKQRDALRAASPR